MQYRFHLLLIVALVRGEETLKLPSQCITKSNDQEKNQHQRIVGGNETGMNEFPWMTALFYGSSINMKNFMCGGSLISENYVLTAAHCLYGKNSIRKWWATFGDHDLSVQNETKIQVRKVAKIIIPKYFDIRTYKFDIALIKLREIVQISESVRPIKLSTLPNKHNETKATIAGWGSLFHKGSKSPNLRKVSVNILNEYSCFDSYRKAGIIFQSEVICASAEGKDSCSGDSGGPLLIRENDQNFTQIGIVSGGLGCADSNYPGVYTKVSSYLRWIQYHLAN